MFTITAWRRSVRLGIFCFYAAGLGAAALLGGCETAHKPRVSSASVSPYRGPPVILRRAVGNTDSKAPILGYDVASSALGFFNAQRVAVGLPAVMWDNRVAKAAAAHARYLIGHGEFSHTEISGSSGFTGSDVTDRLRVQLPVSGTSEVLTRYGNSVSDGEAIRQLFASPYHRGVILFDWQLAGAAEQRADATVLVVDFANIRPVLAENELIAYPYDGQTDVATTWTDNEVPDPLGDDSRFNGQRVGFPITLSGGPNAHIEWRRALLSDAEGIAVPCHIAPLRAADSARNTAICTPLKPLRSATRYRVEAVGLLTQLSRFTTVAPFSLQFTFTTATD